MKVCFQIGMSSGAVVSYLASLASARACLHMPLWAQGRPTLDLSDYDLVSSYLEMFFWCYLCYSSWMLLWIIDCGLPFAKPLYMLSPVCSNSCPCLSQTILKLSNFNDRKNICITYFKRQKHTISMHLSIYETCMLFRWTHIALVINRGCTMKYRDFCQILGYLLSTELCTHYKKTKYVFNYHFRHGIHHPLQQ